MPPRPLNACPNGSRNRATVASNHSGSASSSSHFIQRPSPASVPGLAASATGPVAARR